jgi:hypothetical protein
MKKLLSIFTIAGVCALAMTSYGQGRVEFSNATFDTANYVTVGLQNQGVSGGLAGQGIGGDKYSVQLLWVAGTVLNQATFDASSPGSSATATGAAFLANTGQTDSGQFDAGVVNIGPAGTYTMQILAWYSGTGGFSTYAQALASGAVNTGKSALFTVNVTASPAGINSSVPPAFLVQIVPEPSTLALAGLGAAALLVIRRKK